MSEDEPPAVALLRPDGEMRSLAEIETDVLRFAIAHYRGRMMTVARRLRIGRSTLYRKLADNKTPMV
jgi:DNA-binding NtrC family response regulator